MALNTKLDFDYFAGLETSWDRIKNCGKPVYLYGTGNGCEKIVREFQKHNISFDGIFASDDFARGQTFMGRPVEALSEIEERVSDMCVVLAFGTSLADVMKRIDSIDKKYMLVAPETAVIGDGCFDKQYFLDNFIKARRAYSILSDDVSRKVFRCVTAYKITGNLDYLRECFTDRKESLNLLDLQSDESYVDFGAYDGDTVREFVDSVNSKYSHITAVEPDKHNFQKCVGNSLKYDNISLINCAVWSMNTKICFSGGSGRQARINENGKSVSGVCLDAIAEKTGVSYVKYDVEGAEYEAVVGSVKSIRKYTPKISMALYHHSYDYITLPLLVQSICSDYKFYMRQYSYYPAWETNLICI